NLGLGNAEVMTAPGDSGGPTLLNDQIAGVTSFRARLTFGDIDSQLNSSFGEIGGDTLVSVFASWIDSITDEPGAPQVTNVIISNTVPNSPHAPFSFDTVDGSGLQLRTVPVGGADTVSIQFS